MPASPGFRVLCVNSGSSSLKLALYACVGAEERLEVAGAAERIGLSGGRLWLRGTDGMLEDTCDELRSHAAAVQRLIDALAAHGRAAPDAAGHRLVHGGPEHLAPRRVSAELLADLRRLVPFAPLHLPSEIRAIEAVAARLPALPQVACFDTAFHRRMPAVAQRLPLPRSFFHDGVRRYGFHGLSYEYVLGALGDAAGGRVVIAHLGNGASMVAVRDGRPLDTTMGLTPTGGLMMGTRTGDLDPGVILYLLRERGWDAAVLEEVLDRRAGLLGVSGISSDMQTLLARRGEEPHAAEAVELFCYLARKHVGALAAVLGGLETLVFTGGIGEHAAPVRRDICVGLEFLGVALDPGRNERHAPVISREESRVTVRVVPTNEDLMIARHTRALLGRTA